MTSLPVLVPVERKRTIRSAFVERVAAGNPAAIAELFDEVAPVVRGMLIRTLGATADVDDLVQDVFMVVIRRCRSLEKPEALHSFVVGVTVRTAKKALRVRAMKRWVVWEESHEAPPVTNTYNAIQAEQVRHTYAVLDRMGAEARLVFALRHIEGLELTEAAAASGCSLATFKRHLARAEKHFLALARRDPVLRELVEGES